MQLNYPYSVNNEREGYSPMWYAPNYQNVLQDLDVPVIYAPYSQCGFWPPSGCQDYPMQFLQNYTPPPNTTASLMAALYGMNPPSTSGTSALPASNGVSPSSAPLSPAPTPDSAASTGQALAPITLVSPLPSITAPGPNTVSSSNIPAPASPSFECSLANWVNSNPLMSSLLALGVYFLIAGGKKA